MILMMFLIQLTLIAAIAYMAGRQPWHGVRLPRGANPLELLKDRYARGELNHETFEELWRELE